jgi:cell division protein FtsL
LASWFADAVAAPAPSRTREQAKPAPKPKAKAKPRRRAKARNHGAILWIVVAAVLLAGVVTVNLAVLRANIALDRANQERTKLQADNATLESQLSSALASPRIQALASRKKGLVEADPSTIGYIDLRH